jgi:hypothetical protein
LLDRIATDRLKGAALLVVSLVGMTVMFAAPAAFGQGNIGDIPVKTASKDFLVGDLRETRGEVLLEQRSRVKCPGAIALIQTQSRPATAPVGSFVGQSPPADTPYTCGMSIIRWIASPLKPLPPPPPQFLVGDLATTAAISTLRQRAQQACDGAKFSLRNTWVPSSSKRADYVGQNPDAGAVYRCGEPVAIYRSLGPTPTTPPKPFNVGNLALAQSIETLKANVQATCAQELQLQYVTAASTQPAGTYLRQDPSAEATYACGEAVTVWQSAGPPPPWPVVAGGGLVLAVGGWFGWRWLHPKVGVRAGVPRWSAAPKGPVRLAHPDVAHPDAAQLGVALKVENAAPRAWVRGRLVILE